MLGTLPVFVLADFGAVWVGFGLRPVEHLVLWLTLTLAAAASALPHGRRAVLSGAASFALTGAVLFWFPLGSAKQFYRAAASLETGMPRAEVHRQLSGRLDLSDDDWLRTYRDDKERWYSDPWFAVCDVVYDERDRVAGVSTFAFDPPWGD